MSVVISAGPVRSSGSSGFRAPARSAEPASRHDRPRSTNGYRRQYAKRASNNVRPSGVSGNRDPERKPDPILFQHYFKSIGPRTYAVQIKRAQNQNPYLVITEGKRDEKSGEIRKTRVFVYGEDFDSFIELLRHAAMWIRQHPVSDEFKQKRRQFWQKRQRGGSGRASPAWGEPAASIAAPTVTRQQSPAATKPCEPRAAPSTPAQRASPPAAQTTSSPAGVSSKRVTSASDHHPRPATASGRPPPEPSAPGAAKSPQRRPSPPVTATGSAARFAVSNPPRGGAGSSRSAMSCR